MARYWANINEANLVEKVELLNGFEDKPDSECIDYLRALNKDTQATWIEAYKVDVDNPRGNYPSRGFSYLPDQDVFIHEKPYPSWTLSSDNKRWEQPVAKPADPDWTADAEQTDEERAAAEKLWSWDEDSQSWV